MFVCLNSQQEPKDTEYEPQPETVSNEPPPVQVVRPEPPAGKRKN